jgi:hypothetical protein
MRPGRRDYISSLKLRLDAEEVPSDSHGEGLRPQMEHRTYLGRGISNQISGKDLSHGKTPYVFLNGTPEW